MQNSDGQDCAIATATAFPGAGQGTGAAASQATASASTADASAAAAQATATATASASAAAGQATAQAGDQAFPSEFCIPPAADPPASAPASSSSVPDSMGVLPITEQLATTGEISFDLVESFPADRISDLANFHSLFHYYGIVSMRGRRRGSNVFRIPNVYVFRGTALHVLEQVSCEQMA